MLIAAVTVSVITFPEKAPLTATIPVPETLTMMARMLDSRILPRGALDEDKSEVRILFGVELRTVEVGTEPGAPSSAPTETPSSALTVESSISAVVVSSIRLPIAETCTATMPDPETPTLMPQMTGSEMAEIPIVVSESTVDPPMIPASTVLAITFAETPTPTETVPLPATAKASE